MKRICLADFRTDKGVLPSEQCWEVFDALVERWPEGKLYDLRILERCFSARMGVISLKGKIKSSWEEIVAAEIKGGATQKPVTRYERMAQETVTALGLSKRRLPREQLLAEWQRLTGNPTLDTYYRRLRSIR